MKNIPMLGMIMAMKGEKAPKKRAKSEPKPEPAGPSAPDTYKPPTAAERMKDNARESKVRATRDWVDGHIDSKKHAAIHKRADHVLTDKAPARKLPKGW